MTKAYAAAEWPEDAVGDKKLIDYAVEELTLISGQKALPTLSKKDVASFKLRGRRIFRMAPLHHHFELKGWPEPRVIVRFWIITVVLVLIGLATLKVR